MTTNGLVEGQSSAQAAQPPVGVPPAPLRVSGLLVSKADLLRALAAYVPQICDIRPLDDEQFVLRVGEG